MPLRSRLSLLLVVVLVAPACTSEPTPLCTGPTVRLIRDDVLTVGTDFAYPPFAFDHPDTGKPSGFDVELAQAIADQIGLKLLLVNRTSAALVPGLLAHRHDLAASAIIDRSSLRREVCLSSPYLRADLGLLARRGDPPSVEGLGDLEGRSIGVVKGSRSEGWLRNHLKVGTRVVRFETSEDIPTALERNEVDGAVDDLPILQYARVRSEEFVVVEEIRSDDRYVIAASPDNLGLVQLVNDALSKLRTNGELDALLGRWFGR